MRHEQEARALLVMLVGGLGALRAEGLVRSWRVVHDEVNAHDTLRLELTSGGWRSYMFTEHEFRMEGTRAFERWLEHVCRDVRGRYAVEPWQRPHPDSRVAPRPEQASFNLTANEVMRRREEAFDAMRQYMDLGAPRLRPEQVRELLFVFEDRSPEEKKASAAANAKARELFRSVAGDVALAKLERPGSWLPVTGSSGEMYHLFNRSTYSVERPRDGAALCAVVPGVPLWDHLLGLKLIIETDEPRFLKVANVSRGGMVPLRGRAVDPNRRHWDDYWRD